MKKFFYSHPDTVIAALALILLVVLLSFYLWASNGIYTEIYRAFTFTPAQPSDSFNLTGAARLDLRGIAVGTSSPAAAPAPTATSAFAQGASTTASIASATPALPGAAATTTRR